MYSYRDERDDVTYPHLYEISLSRAKVEPDHLASLFLRHKATLRRLYLADLQFVESMSWLDVSAKFAGKLPNLRKVKLRAPFTDSEFETELDFDIPGMESRRIFPAREAVENFILKGSESPVNLDELPDEYTCYPHEQEGYVPPGLPMENIAADDPALEYESDGFNYFT